jgi:hypothetical protein
MLIAVQELSGDAEIGRLIDMRKSSMNGAFVPFILGLTSYALWVLRWSLTYYRTWAMVIAVFVLMLIVIIWIIFGWPSLFGLLKDVYNVKAETLQGQKAAGGLPVVPIVVNREQIHNHITKLKETLPLPDCSPGLLSPDLVLVYILYKEGGKEGGTGNSGKRKLAWMTMKALEEPRKSTKNTKSSFRNLENRR